MLSSTSEGATDVYCLSLMNNVKECEWENGQYGRQVSPINMKAKKSKLLPASLWRENVLGTWLLARCRLMRFTGSGVFSAHSVVFCSLYSLSARRAALKGKWSIRVSQPIYLLAPAWADVISNSSVEVALQLPDLLTAPCCWQTCCRSV